MPLIDASAIGMRLRGLNVAVMAGYLDDQKEQLAASRANLVKLHNWAEFIKSLGVPFVMAADFNLTPDALRDSSAWLDDLGADILLANVELTCTAGKGRTLDYVVYSRCLGPLIKVEADADAAWTARRPSDQL